MAKKIVKKITKKQVMREERLPWYKTEIGVGRVKMVDIAMLSKHLSVMLGSGLTVPDALDVIHDQASGKVRAVIGRVNRRVHGGSAFSDALSFERKVFSPSFISAVRIGENSGTLDANLSRLSTQLEKDLTLRRNVQSAMIYPSVVITLAAVLGFAVAIYVLPQIADIFESLRVELPLSTRILIAFARFFELYGIITAGALLFLGIFTYIGVKQKFMKPFVDWVVLAMPIAGNFMHLANRARFCRTLSTLLESGTPIEEALEITSEVMQSHQYQKSAEYLLREVGSGADLSKIIKRYPHLYPPIIERMVAVGEQSGGLGKTLAYLADYYEERVLVMSKNLSALIEPFLLVLIGLVVAGLAASILTPIYSVLSGVQG